VVISGNISPTIDGFQVTGGNAAGLGGDPDGDDLGGGIYVVYADSAAILNTALHSNEAGMGGGIAIVDSSNIELVNVTFSGNAASSSGGALHNDNSGSKLTNCILWGNTATTGGGQIHNESGILQVAYSDVEGGWIGVLNIGADPLFVDADGGDLHIGAGSPVINSGSNSAVDSTTDLDGMPRIVCGIVDMGAYERQTCP
jgi:hypothetical protein